MHMCIPNYSTSEISCLLWPGSMKDGADGESTDQIPRLSGPWARMRDCLPRYAGVLREKRRMVYLDILRHRNGQDMATINRQLGHIDTGHRPRTSTEIQWIPAVTRGIAVLCICSVTKLGTQQLALL